ncbi:MAG: sodium:calcium antiporter [Alistipes sp.]
MVAVGTSTPGRVVSVLSAAAGNSDVAIGNVVGSNLFNVFLILGVCALIRPLPLTRSNIRRDIPFGMAASLILLAVTSDRLIVMRGRRTESAASTASSWWRSTLR